MNVRKIIYILFLMLGTFGICFSCSTSKKIESNIGFCNENFKFKTVYFGNIQNIENLIYNDQNESFHNSLKFISNYAHVNFESMMNYSNTYSSVAFEEDKKNWILWYENNKCKNIQFKDSVR